jgi:hypothetical protein
VKNDLLLFVNGSLDFVSVQNQKSFHHRVSDPLVAVNERMIPDQREAESRGLVDERGIEVFLRRSSAVVREPIPNRSDRATPIHPQTVE